MLEENSIEASPGDVADAAVATPLGAPRSRSALFRPVLLALRRALTPPPDSAWRDPVIWVIAVATFGAYFVISLFRLLQMATSSLDLGIFTAFMKQLSQLHSPVDDVLGSGYNFEGNHFEIAVGVIAPFFRLFPTPATLLFCQALFAAVSVFPVASAARSLTGRGTGRLIGFAYACSWGLQQMIAFDFHEVAVAVPLLAFSVSALVRRRPGAAIAWAMPLVFVKEDQGFTVAAIGALLAATAVFSRLRPGPEALPAALTQPGRVRLRLSGSVLPGDGLRDADYNALWGGAFLAGWGLFWTVLAITVIIPRFNPLHQYYFWDVGGAVGSGKPLSASTLLVQAGGNWPVKGPTVALLLLPTAFAALGSPVVLLAVPSLLLRFISTNPSYWGTGWHYDATVMPILFIAAAEAIGRWRRATARAAPSAGNDGLLGLVRAAQTGLARHGGAMMAAIAVALAFQFPLSGLWNSATYRVDDSRDAAASAAMAVVPDGATVTATVDLVAPLAARTDTFYIGNPGNPVTQYIVFDGSSPPVTDVPGLIAGQYRGDGYRQVFESSGIYVFRRG